VIRATLALLATSLAACGGARATEADANEPPPPLTDRDPPAYIPPPAAGGHTGDIASLAAAGGYEQARSIALRLIAAARDGSEEALVSLLDERLGRVLPRLSGPSRERALVIRHVLFSPARGELGPDVPLESLVEQERVEVAPLSRHLQGQPIPPGLLGTDLLVTVPLTAQGRQQLRVLFNWPLDGAVLVRPGAEPRIVGL
jgi:hypothetical protein